MLIVLAAGCGSATTTGAGAASVVPAGVPVYIAIDSDPDSSQWRTMNALADQFPDKQKAVDALERSLRNEAGLDFERDVKPALGPEIDVVWLDFDHGGNDVVALMQPNDEAAFQRAVAQGNAKDPSDQLLYEKVGDWEVMSERRAAIDTFKRMADPNGPMLADDPAFSRAMDEYSDDALVKAYVSGAAVMDKLRSSIPADARDLVDKLGTLDWIAGSIRTTADGVRLDTTVRGVPGSLLRSAGSNAGSSFEPALPNLIPDDALAYFAFHGTAGMLSGIRDNPALAGPDLEPVREILRKIGTLMEGEDALYVRPGTDRLPEVTLVTEPSPGYDPAIVLDGILADAHFASHVERTTIDGHEARVIPLGGDVRILYADVGGNLVVTDLPAGISGFASGGPALAQSDRYSDAVTASGAPKKVEELFYVDVRGGVDLAKRLSSAPIPDEVKRNLGPLRSAVQYAASRPSEVQLTFFVRISRQ